MNPNYKQTVTVYRRTPAKDTPDRKERWTREVISGCFWKSQTMTLQNGTEAQKANTYIVRIPVKAVGFGWVCKPGDIVVKGECTAEGSESVLLANKPNAFKVQTYSDNTDWIGAHYRLEG